MTRPAELDAAITAMGDTIARTMSLEDQLHASIDAGITSLRERAEWAERALRDIRGECRTRIAGGTSARPDGAFLLRIIILTGIGLGDAP